MTTQEIQSALAAPFAANEVKWKPQAVKDGRALAVAYIDARCVAERLDDVLGIGGWQDTYNVLPGGGVVCRLELRIDGDWIAKEGVGGESKQPDAGDRIKAAFSAAFKLAAVKWGIGRYLYALPKQWCAYDEQRKAFRETPRLTTTATATPTKCNGNGKLPVNGAELLSRLKTRVKEELAAGHGKAADLIAHLEAEGGKRGYGLMPTWTTAAIAWAATETTAFLAAKNAA